MTIHLSTVQPYHTTFLISSHLSQIHIFRKMVEVLEHYQFIRVDNFMQLQRKEHGQMFTSTTEIINSTEYCRREQKDLIQMPVFQKMEKNLPPSDHLQTIKLVSGTGNKKIFY